MDFGLTLSLKLLVIDIVSGTCSLQVIDLSLLTAQMKSKSMIFAWARGLRLFHPCTTVTANPSSGGITQF